MKHWNSLNNDERYFLEMVLSFFAGSDFIVNEHIETDFLCKIKFLEAKIYYDFQKMMENVHSQTYADLINYYVKDNDRKEELRHAVERIPAVKKKGDWAKHYIYKQKGDEETFVRRFVNFSF